MDKWLVSGCDTVQSDNILTLVSYDDDWLKKVLVRLLWGYPKLVDSLPFSVLANARRQILQARNHLHSAQHPADAHHTDPDTNRMERSDSLSMDIYDDESLPSYDAENHPGNDFEQTATQNTPMRYDPITGTV